MVNQKSSLHQDVGMNSYKIKFPVKHMLDLIGFKVFLVDVWLRYLYVTPKLKPLTYAIPRRFPNHTIPAEFKIGYSILSNYVVSL